eukprot:6459236-Amphidinium_carterae.1
MSPSCKLYQSPSCHLAIVAWLPVSVYATLVGVVGWVTGPHAKRQSNSPIDISRNWAPKMESSNRV